MLERIFKSFIWGHEEGKRALPLVSWKAICQLKSYGGLGVHDVKARHNLFFAKVAAHLILNYISLWSKVVSNKYYFNGSWENDSHGRNTSSMWKAICNLLGLCNMNFSGKLVVALVIYNPWQRNIPLNRLLIFINMDCLSDNFLVSRFITRQHTLNSLSLKVVFAPPLLL